MAPASAQLSRHTFGGLPLWADSALSAAGLGQRFVLSSELNTIYEFGDFDRDGLNWRASWGVASLPDARGHGRVGRDLLYISQPGAPSGCVVWDGRDYVWIDED